MAQNSDCTLCEQFSYAEDSTPLPHVDQKSSKTGIVG